MNAERHKSFTEANHGFARLSPVSHVVTGWIVGSITVHQSRFTAARNSLRE